jgi:hypothetical protein
VRPDPRARRSLTRARERLKAVPVGHGDGGACRRRSYGATGHGQTIAAVIATCNRVAGAAARATKRSPAISEFSAAPRNKSNITSNGECRSQCPRCARGYLNACAGIVDLIEGGAEAPPSPFGGIKKVTRARGRITVVTRLRAIMGDHPAGSARVFANGIAGSSRSHGDEKPCD